MPTFTNKATLSYNGITVDSNTVTGNYAALLSATKTALNETYGTGSRITYVVSLVNPGTSSLSGLSVTDDLGGYEFDTATVYPLSYVEGSLLYLVNGVPEAEPLITVGPPLVINGINVPAGGNITLVYEADVNEFAPPAVGSEITNTVTVSGAGLPENVTATETVTAAEGPTLTITKALFPTTVVENGEITYTFVIENSGNTEIVATDNATVSDLFDPILDISSVTLDGATLSLGTGYSYNTASGLFETLPGVITVPAATYTQNPDGSFTTVPGTATLTVTGTI